LLRALVSAADLRPARSYTSSPSSTQMVVWNEERLLFGRFAETSTASQFQPPSSSCSRRSRRASASFGSLKYAPTARILPLMQGSVSPSTKDRLSTSLTPHHLLS